MNDGCKCASAKMVLLMKEKRWKKEIVDSATPAPGIMLSNIHFIWTAVQTEKLTQIQISQKSKSGFVIKSFNILKCLNWRKHRNSLRKQNKADARGATNWIIFEISKVIKCCQFVILFDSILDLRKKKKVICVFWIKNIPCKKFDLLSILSAVGYHFYWMTRWVGLHSYPMLYVGIKGNTDTRLRY